MVPRAAVGGGGQQAMRVRQHTLESGRAEGLAQPLEYMGPEGFLDSHSLAVQKQFS